MAKMSTANTRKAINNFMNKNKNKDKDVVDNQDNIETSEVEETAGTTTKLNLDDRSKLSDLRDELESMSKEDTSEDINDNKLQKPHIPEVINKDVVDNKEPQDDYRSPLVNTKTLLREQRKKDNREYNVNSDFKYQQPEVHHSNDVKIINIPADRDVQPLHIDSIRDSKGYICDRINRIEDETGVSVLPFNKLGLLPQVEYIQGHEMITVYGDKYVTGNTRIVNENMLYQYVDKIERNIISGMEFDESLIVSSDFKNERITTLKFNIKELAFIKAKFQQLPCTVYETATGDIRINVGGMYV